MTDGMWFLLGAGCGVWFSVFVLLLLKNAR
jgi:hypothetical protein